MCSIIGFINKHHKADVHIADAMNAVLKHRGPDDSGTAVMKMFQSCQENIGIGFNRLSIRDISDAGHQPMYGTNGDVVITFNGEIYNADAYRDKLKESGHSFAGTSDTEVLLYLYEDYGIDRMLEMIDGMYAICIADKKRDSIYLIRDKTGEKPLYYYSSQDVFMWASEYKAFYENPLFQARLDTESLSEYLMFRYVSNGKTLLQNVRNLKPGTYLEIKRTGITQKTYWNLPDGRNKDKRNAAEIKKDFKRHLEKAFQSRMVSDVEIGVQLSGGVDSSTLAEYANRVSDHRLKTFGIVFDGKKYSEKKYMESAADRCGTDSYLYNFSNSQFLDSWKNTVYYFEEPMNHEGTLGLFLLNRNASRLVKVMLCGEGADETMGGYQRFYDYIRNKKYPLYRTRSFIKTLLREKRIDFTVFLDAEMNFIQSVQYVNSRDARILYAGCDTEGILRKRKMLFEKMPGTGLDKAMNYEVFTYCQDLLMRADKVSMASSLEVRVPYLMPELIEFERTLPEHFFVSQENGEVMRNTKKLLKSICRDIFGDEFAYRKKQGFGIPIMDYFSEGEVKQFIEKEVLPGIRKRGILNASAVESVYSSKCLEKNRKNDSRVFMLWTAFSFEIWASMYLDGNPNTKYQELSKNRNWCKIRSENNRT